MNINRETLRFGHYSLFLICLGIASYLLACVVSFFLAMPDLIHASAIGRGENFFQYDLLNFVSAHRLFTSNLNPYLVDAQNEYFRTAINSNYPHQLNFLYPPLALIVFSGLLFLPFSVLSTLWLFLSILAIAISVDLLLPDSVSGMRRILAVVFGVSFAPVLNALYWGQFSAFLVLFLVLAIRSINSSRGVFSALLLCCCLIKPQTWFLAGVGIFAWSVRQKNFNLMFMLLVVTSLFVALAEYLLPGIHAFWWNSLGFVSAHADYSLTPTLASHLRLLAIEMFGIDVGSGFYSLVAIVASMIFAVIVFVQRKWKLEEVVSLGLLFSPVLAPYGWSHDQVVMLIPLLSCLSAESKNQDSKYFYFLFITSLVASFYLQLSDAAQHQSFWFALVYICIYLFRSFRKTL